jgi:hypothetical protein
MTTVDYIVIGSSPISLVKAAILQSTGNEVLVIDESDSMGGAWKTVKYPTLPELEIGCHIWSAHKVGYELISQLFDLNLVPMSPQPIMTKGRINIPYDLKANLITTKNLGKAMMKFNSTALKKVRQNPSFKLSPIPSKYMYLKKGALEFKSALEQFCEKHQLEILLRTSIRKIEANLETLLLTDQNLNQYLAQKGIVVTALSELQEILVDEKPFPIECRQEAYIHYHLLIKGPCVKRFSYHRILNHDIFHRVSDMTAQGEGKIASDESILSIAIHKNAYNKLSEEDRVLAIKEFLLKRKYISSEHEIKTIAHNAYPCQYNNRSQLAKLKTLTQGRIDFIHSTDFIYSFLNLETEIRALLNRNN